MTLNGWKWSPNMKSKSYSKMNKSELALMFKVIQEQIKESKGIVRKKLIKERNEIVRAYKIK